MPISNSNKENISTGTPDYCDPRADQEEIYREEGEEAVHQVLESDELLPLQNNGSYMADSLGEQLDHAARALITGDADDPPLSEQAIRNMLQDRPQDRTA
jgi:hypothetical protein